MNEACANRKILVIEDDLALLDLVRHVLERQGCKVFRADNGADGVRLNAEQNPDLIVLDLRMPGMDGIETLRRIRKDDEEVLVVILTGHGSPESIRDAADLNVTEYLSKPFENRDLVSIIAKALVP